MIRFQNLKILNIALFQIISNNLFYLFLNRQIKETICRVTDIIISFKKIIDTIA